MNKANRARAPYSGDGTFRIRHSELRNKARIVAACKILLKTQTDDVEVLNAPGTEITIMFTDAPSVEKMDAVLDALTRAHAAPESGFRLTYTHGKTEGVTFFGTEEQQRNAERLVLIAEIRAHLRAGRLTATNLNDLIHENWEEGEEGEHE